MQHEAINYLELPASDFESTRAFYTSVFAWQFTEYGDDYLAFSDAEMDGGFFKSSHVSRQSEGAALIVFYSQDLESTQDKVLLAKGEICQPIFKFPGGRRFHFLDPNGNELAVWSDQ